jgi:Plasmid pRiA4b ORF-3-like protein
MIYQLKIQLKYLNPPIWRRVLMSSNAPVQELHFAIQIAMGWENAHLHCFIHNTKMYEPTNEEGDMIDGAPYDDLVIADFLKEEEDTVEYQYDFGDSWEHIITLEKILPDDENQPLPHILDGEMACPPEDCGGFPGYENLVKVMKKPSSKAAKELIEWLGEPFDANDFIPEDLQIINEIFEEYRKWKKQQ